MGTMDEDIAAQERLTSEITRILTHYDPATIMIREHNNEDEYETEAREIASWIRQTANPARADLRLLREGIQAILEKRLGVDCMRIEEIAGDIQQLI